MQSNLENFFKYAIVNPNTYGEKYRNIINNKKIQNASVLVIFYVHNYNDISVVLTLRAKKLTLHAGEISFIGGKHDQQDKNFFDTALREAYEETYLLKEDIIIYGKLPQILVPSGFNIHPILATTSKYINNVNTDEVEKILLIPSEFVLNDKNYHITKTNFKNNYFERISIKYLKYNVWGVTANILYRLAQTYSNYKLTNELMD